MSTEELKKETSITKAELKSLQELIHEQREIQLQIGGLEGQKFELLSALNRATDSLSGLQQRLENIYGSVNINLNNGSITDVSEAN